MKRAQGGGRNVNLKTPRAVTAIAELRESVFYAATAIAPSLHGRALRRKSVQTVRLWGITNTSFFHNKENDFVAYPCFKLDRKKPVTAHEVEVDTNTILWETVPSSMAASLHQDIELSRLNMNVSLSTLLPPLQRCITGEGKFRERMHKRDLKHRTLGWFQSPSPFYFYPLI